MGRSSTIPVSPYHSQIMMVSGALSAWFLVPTSHVTYDYCEQNMIQVGRSCFNPSSYPCPYSEFATLFKVYSTWVTQ